MNLLDLKFIYGWASVVEIDCSSGLNRDTFLLIDGKRGKSIVKT